ncbi:histidine phosphatase family protein [Phenylobacterium sp.]|uniref:histidine phosphatase family protein n=1 Tax=Phenylobacterium sp. TaxID=1871053 RepID=UPI0019853069|nr:histidine phosphatase family protein [Phenylobacterium sp.]MBC7168993.1 histidine phosphatase family protein [Phenylobacterium sp.]
MALIFVTHPEVEIDPDVPVPHWRLSDRGVARMRAFVASDVVAGVSAVWASTETKAIEAAGLLAARHGLPVQVREDLGENDRSATGFVPPDRFERLADAFFAHPEESVRGWETAAAAQGRIVAATMEILQAHPGPGDVAIVAHGGVGTLLLCHLKGLPIARAHDQPHQGCWWRHDPKSGAAPEGWASIAMR